MAVRRVVLPALAALLIFAAHRQLTDPLSRLHHEGDSYAGSWWLPRGGPYILGYDAPGDAELRIDDLVVAHGSGEQSRRVVFEAGAHSVLFRCPAASRLLWHPPGRRGALEYVPASSLSRSGQFGFGVGAYLPAAILTTLAVLALLLLLWLEWRPRVDLSILGVFLIALAVRLLMAYGQTWDEDEYWSAGRNYLVNLLGFDFRETSWRWNFQHPPVTKYLAGLGALWADGYFPARAIFALLGATGCAFAADLGKRLFGARAGLFAGVIAAFTPRLIAHDQIVGHEAPSVFFWTVAVWLALKAKERPKAIYALGVVLGLAIGTRFTNLLCVPLALGIVVLHSPCVRSALAAFLAASIGLVTFVATWPRMWTAPLAHLHQGWQLLNQQHLPEAYLGAVVQLPPWHYFPVYVLATAPLAVLLAAGIGAWHARKNALVAFAWFLLPFGVALSPVRQDGVRYVLPALVPLALFAGVGIDALAAKWRFAPAALGTYLLFTSARIYPYYLDYYGEQVGGPASASRKGWFETGWGGEGIGGAVDVVNGRGKPNARVQRILQPTHVNWLRADLWSEASAEESDWLIVNDAGIAAHRLWGRNSPRLENMQLVYEARAQGASLVRVYRRH